MRPVSALKAHVLGAGALYFAAIFALGFVLGTLRALWLTRALGALPAVLLELPVMLAASWLVARWLLRRQMLAGRVFGAAEALAMGGFAFILLMLAEAGLAYVLAGQGPGEWLAAMARPAGLAGLAGQILFALIPLLARRGGRFAQGSG